MLPQPAHDPGHILPGDFLDHRQVFFADICGAVPEYIVDHIIIDGCAELPHELLPDGQHALVSSVFLGVAFLRIGFPVADGHDVHGAIADVAEHGCALEFRQLIRHSREALREDVTSDNPDAVSSAIEAELHVLPLDQVFAEAVFLLRYPGQGQSDSQMDIGAGQMRQLQLPGDSGKRQDVVVLIRHLVRDEFLVFLADAVPLAVVLKRSDDEEWFLVIGGHTCPEAGVGRLDVSVAVVDPNHYGGVLCVVTGVGKQLIFDQYDSSLKNQFLSLVTPILSNVKANGGIYDYYIEVDDSVEARDAHTLPCTIHVKPTPTLEYIDLTFTIYPESVDFRF